MRAIHQIMLAILLIGIASAHAAERALPFDAKGADGTAIHFDPAHLERPALLLFWATWCPYCKALMPHVQKVYDAAGRNALDVYAIDINDDGDALAELKERQQTFTLVRDGDEIAAQYGIKGTPGLLLIDSKGDIVYRRVGGDEPASVEAVLRQHLGLQPAPHSGN